MYTDIFEGNAIKQRSISDMCIFCLLLIFLFDLYTEFILNLYLCSYSVKLSVAFKLAASSSTFLLK